MVGPEDVKKKPPTEAPMGNAAKQEPEENGSDASENRPVIPLQPFGYKRYDREGGLRFNNLASAVGTLVPSDELLHLKQKYADSFLKDREDDKQKTKWALNMLEQFYMFGAAFGFDSEAMARNRHFAPGFLRSDASNPKRIATSGSFHRIKERIAQLTQCFASYTEIYPYISMPTAAASMQKQDLPTLLGNSKVTLRLAAIDAAREKHRIGEHIVTIDAENIAESLASLIAIATCDRCVRNLCEIRVHYFETGEPEKKAEFENLDVVRAACQAFIDSVVGYGHPQGESQWNQNPMQCTKFSFDLSKDGLPMWMDNEPKQSVRIEVVLKLVCFDGLIVKYSILQVVSVDEPENAVVPLIDDSEKQSVSVEDPENAIVPLIDDDDEQEPIVTDDEIEDPPPDFWFSVFHPVTRRSYESSENGDP